MLFYGGRLRWAVVAVCIIVAGLAVTTARDSILKVAAPTIASTTGLAERGLAHVDLLEAMRQTVEDPNTPNSMRERLMLWTNALDAVRSSPWIGWGNLWQREWRQGTYSDTSHRLLHNGYLEILVRHGALGALMLTLFAAVAAQRLHRAWRQGVISSSLMLYLYSLSFFFFITIASNSNNRLALGESYFLLTAAAVFAISMAMRERSLRQVSGKTGSHISS
jgi:O-antigen ligase